MNSAKWTLAAITIALTTIATGCQNPFKSEVKPSNPFLDREDPDDDPSSSGPFESRRFESQSSNNPVDGGATDNLAPNRRLDDPATGPVRPVSYNQSRGTWLFSSAGRTADTPVEVQPTGSQDDALSLDPRRLTDGIAKLRTDREAAVADYQAGEAAFSRRQYAEAATSYKSAMTKAPNSPLEQTALFKLGESYFFDDNYPSAVNAYSDLLKKNANTKYLDKSVARLFSIARYWELSEAKQPSSWYGLNFFDKRFPKRNRVGYARSIYNQVYLADPTGKMADDCIMAMANYYFRKGRFEDADHYYSLLRREYAKSEHILQAFLLGIQAKLRKYQGPDYDETPLSEAEELVQQVMSQFPEQVRPQRDRLLTIQRQIQFNKARSLWVLAEYYEGAENFRSAKITYEKLVTEYPQSQMAQRGRERLASIADKPDNAPDYVPWLTEVFEPQRKKRR